MSWKNASGAAPKLELKLNLSPPRESSPSRRRSVSTSPPSSCMSSESQDDDGGSAEEATSMVLVGCPRCLMYVMLAQAKPNKCPMCHTSVLLDVLFDHTKNART
nr:uncharacterized protein LOC103486655 [Ipomoea trifida]GMD86757.1 early nodulin-20-like isoform X1 [Ipomoea batatas]